MTEDVWRELFDSLAPQHMNEVFTRMGRNGRVSGRRPIGLGGMEIMVVTRRPPA